MKLIFPFHNLFNAWLYLLSATRKSLPGLRRLRALVLTTVSPENPCSQRYVVENRSRKVVASLPIFGFTFVLRSRTLQVTLWLKVVDVTGHDASQ